MGIAKANKIFTPREKFQAGYEAFAGKPVTGVSQKYHMSRQYVYEQKEKVGDFLDSLDIGVEKEDPRNIRMTREFVNRVVISLSLDCHGTTEGIRRFCDCVLGIHVSTGAVSAMLSEAAGRAREFDDTVCLSGIAQGANDEVFQGNSPVLVGVDPKSTYVYLLEEASDRTADTWEAFMEDRKDHGLDLEVSLSDSGSGLLSGIGKAFPNAQVQSDVFHALRGLGTEVSKEERKAYSMINEEYEKEKAYAARSRDTKKFGDYLKARRKAREATSRYDTLSILFQWLGELLGFSGYGHAETLPLLHFVLDEMLLVGGDGIAKEVKKTRKNLEGLASFHQRLENEMAKRSHASGLPPGALEALYRLRRNDMRKGNDFSKATNEVCLALGDRYAEAESLLHETMSDIQRASSMVENVNSRIRSYMNIKRMVPTKYFILLKVYVNTRHYVRSRKEERRGKSPLELLTGEEQADFLEILGY